MRSRKDLNTSEWLALGQLLFSRTRGRCSQQSQWLLFGDFIRTSKRLFFKLCPCLKVCLTPCPNLVPPRAKREPSLALTQLGCTPDTRSFLLIKYCECLLLVNCEHGGSHIVTDMRATSFGWLGVPFWEMVPLHFPWACTIPSFTLAAQILEHSDPLRTMFRCHAVC